MTILENNRHDKGYPKSPTTEERTRQAVILADKMAATANAAKAVLRSYSDKEITADERLTALALELDGLEAFLNAND